MATSVARAERALEGVPTQILIHGGTKQSGIGREMGWAGIEDCTEEKLVAMAL